MIICSCSRFALNVGQVIGRRFLFFFGYLEGPPLQCTDFPAKDLLARHAVKSDHPMHRNAVRR
jgi:hypothetical protein